MLHARSYIGVHIQLNLLWCDPDIDSDYTEEEQKWLGIKL